MRPVTGKKKAILTAAGLGAGLAVRQLLSRRSEENLRGQVVLITGGSKGLGVALARQFAREGCRLAICARNREELHGGKRELERRGAQVLAIPCDVTDEAQVKQMVADVTGHYGGIDILVNNAGQTQVGPVTAMTVKDFDSAMKVMFWGVVFPTLASIPAMVKRRSGKIVTITAFDGKVTVPHMMPYTCAKFAATGFSEGLRAELSQEGIQVMTIAPGPLRTGSFGSAPVLAMSADTAAKKIVTAVKRGESEHVLASGAKALSGFHGLFPGAAANLIGILAAALLPAATGATGATKKPVMNMLLTLGRSAAQRFRQRPA